MEHNVVQPVRRRMRRKSLVFGLLVMGAGLVWLMHNFGWISGSAWEVIWSWQMLLISIGVINVANDGSKGFGWVLIAIGGFFMINEFYDLPFTFKRAFWPALLIAIGLFLIFGSRKWHHRKPFSVSQGEDFIEEVAVFGGGDRIIHSEAFRGGRVVSVFGGSKIDMTRVILAPGNVEIEIVSIFGGSTIIAPPDWNIKLEVFNIFGGYSDKRMPSQVDYSKTIVVKGVAIFGGGEIKSF